MNNCQRWIRIIGGISISLGFGFFLNSCDRSGGEVIHNSPKQSSLEMIKARGKLIVITDYNSTSYFFYRGRPLGFNYDVLKAFAEHLGVGLNVGISTTVDNTFNCLSHNGCDIVALNLPLTKETNLQFYYTKPILSSAPVLVQRKPADWERLSVRVLDKRMIRNPGFLAGKEVVIPNGSPFLRLLQEHSVESGDTIRIKENLELTTEQLIHGVAAGELPYTVAFEDIARVNQMYYPVLDIKTHIGPTQDIVWAVSRSSPDLLKDFNRWLTRFKKTKRYKALYDKYYVSDRITRIRGSKMFSIRHGKISPYDEIFQKYAKIIGWDWRLLASLCYHESKFHSDTVAWSGATGLMQLMPWIMQEYGVESNSSPDRQILSGVKYLASIDKQFIKLVPDKDERTKFVLAAYNVGIAHVLDARRLAKKYNRKDNVWTNEVDSFILKKSYPKYYHDKLAFYGYCRGEEPFRFVREVFEIYELYKNAIRY